MHENNCRGTQKQCQHIELVDTICANISNQRNPAVLRQKALSQTCADLAGLGLMSEPAQWGNEAMLQQGDVLNGASLMRAMTWFNGL